MLYEVADVPIHALIYYADFSGKDIVGTNDQGSDVLDPIFLVASPHLQRPRGINLR